ncbi:MAG: ATP-binding protein [Thermodesulfovibrionales bacterium]|jgi:PAS domain S-box-containing protein
MEHIRAAQTIKEYVGDASILFIDDSLLDHELIRMVFRRYEMDSNLEFVSSAEAGLDTISRQRVKAVFVNQILPDADAFEFLSAMKKLSVGIPVIMMMLQGNEDLERRALREGAHDCMIKSIRYFDSLPLILDRALARYELDSERADKERLICESRKYWMAIFDAITDFIFITDSNGRILKANRALALSFGKHPTSILGQQCDELFGDRSPEIYKGEDNELPQTEERTIHGETFLVSTFPLTYHDECLTVHVMKNITEMKRLKDQLFHADKLSSLGLLVSGVAHEINNPLTGIIAYTELLRMKVIDQEIEKDFKKILESADRCKKIVENLLTFSRQRTPSRTLESINDIIDRAVDLRSYWLSSSNIEIRKDYGVSQSVFVDSQQMQQVILNILLNAEQAIAGSNGRNGKITFVTHPDTDRHRVIVRISDNGPGIPEDIVSRIFDPFFTTKQVGAGTGLGLSISHGIVTEHGGSIVVENAEGDGATFIIELPLPAKGECLDFAADYKPPACEGEVAETGSEKKQNEEQP